MKCYYCNSTEHEDDPCPVRAADAERFVKLSPYNKILADSDNTRKGGRGSIIAKLACWHGGHNASENSWGRLGMQVNIDDDEAVAKYFYEQISADARKPLEAEIINLKARLFKYEC